MKYIPAGIIFDYILILQPITIVFKMIILLNASIQEFISGFVYLSFVLRVFMYSYCM